MGSLSFPTLIEFSQLRSHPSWFITYFPRRARFAFWLLFFGIEQTIYGFARPRPHPRPRPRESSFGCAFYFRVACLSTCFCSAPSLLTLETMWEQERQGHPESLDVYILENLERWFFQYSFCTTSVLTQVSGWQKVSSSLYCWQKVGSSLYCSQKVRSSLYCWKKVSSSLYCSQKVSFTLYSWQKVSFILYSW